jgi:hypothetical protein
MGAQIFIGMDTLIIDAHGAKTDGKFVQHLQDVIQKGGAILKYPRKLWISSGTMLSTIVIGNLNIRIRIVLNIVIAVSKSTPITSS